MKSKISDQPTPRSRQILRATAGIIASLTGLHLLLQYLNLNVFYEKQGHIFELSNRFDLDDELSLATWVSLLLFLAIGLSALMAAYLENNRHKRRPWIILGWLGILLSLDEAVGLHEYVLQGIHVLAYKDAPPSFIANAWLLVAPIVLLITAWFFMRTLILMPKATKILFAKAIFIFLTGAIVVDILASSTDKLTYLNQGILVAAEESLELMGIAIVLYAVAQHIELNYASRIGKAIRELNGRNP